MIYFGAGIEPHRCNKLTHGAEFASILGSSSTMKKTFTVAALLGGPASVLAGYIKKRSSKRRFRSQGCHLLPLAVFATRAQLRYHRPVPRRIGGNESVPRTRPWSCGASTVLASSNWRLQRQRQRRSATAVTSVCRAESSCASAASNPICTMRFCRSSSISWSKPITSS